MSKVQTDNDKRFLDFKIKLRIDNLPFKKNITVLECFAGDGILWDAVKKVAKDKEIKILKMDIKKKKGVYLKGDNLKFLNMDLSMFDIIDLDAYGIPIKQLQEVFNQNYKGIIHITAIQTMMGKLPNILLNDLGYTNEMIKKIPSLFNVNGFDKFKQWLALNGIKEIEGYSKDNKNYYVFKTI